MLDLKLIPRVGVVLSCCGLMSGCFIKEVVKSELSSYDEPKQDGVAYLWKNRGQSRVS